MKAYIWILLAACFYVCGAVKCGDDVECDLDEQGVMTIAGTGDMFEYDNKDKRPDWYSDHEKIKKVSVGDGVTSVGNYSFADCINLETIEFADSVTLIKEYAFFNCSSLESLDLAKIEEIRTDAFAFCISLPSISLPATLADMTHGAFRGCSKLASFVVAEGNPSFKAEDGVLFSQDGATLLAFPPGLENASYTAPDDVTVLGEYCFAHCDHLVEVVLKEGITQLPYRCFQYSPALERVTIPNGVKSIKQSVFQECRSLKSIVIPDSVTGIGRHTFSGCKDLHDVTLSVNMTRIMDHTFDCCTSLESITIPPKVDSLEYHAFYGCTELRTIYFMGNPDTPVANKSGVFEKCDKLDHVCVSEDYKFDNFCGIPAAVCSAGSSSGSSAAPVTPSSTAPHSSTASAFVSLPSLALIAALLLSIFF